MAITGVAELIYHCNIRTPYWLGFIFQRPESHSGITSSGTTVTTTPTCPCGTCCLGHSTTRAKIRPSAVSATRVELQLVRMLLGRAPR